MKRALITGKGGGIGNALETKLKTRDWEVFRLPLRKSRFKIPLSIDLLVLNACYYHHKELASTKLETIKEQIKVNLEYPLALIRYYLSKDDLVGATVILLSTKDLTLFRTPKQVIYNATKAAMEEVMLSMQVEEPSTKWKIIRLPLVNTSMLDHSRPFRERPLTVFQASSLILKEVL